MEMKTAQLTTEQAEAVRKQLAKGMDPRSICVTRTEAKRRAGDMNKGEAAFGRHLQWRKENGEVLWYAFEPIRLKLGDRCHFSPDFAAIELRPEHGGWRLCFYDCKGKKGDSYYAKEDAVIKIKTAATIYRCFTFAIVWPDKGTWLKREFT